MKRRQRSHTTHKVIFSEEVDNKLNGISLGCAFITIGLLLFFCPNYFGNERLRTYFVWAFVIVGFIGLFVEADRGKTIKGFSNIAVGTIFLLIWFWLYNCEATTNLLIALVSLLLLTVGVYAIVLGAIQVVYSFWVNFLSIKGKGKKIKWSDVILFLTKLASLALIVAQIVKTCIG